MDMCSCTHAEDRHLHLATSNRCADCTCDGYEPAPSPVGTTEPPAGSGMGLRRDTLVYVIGVMLVVALFFGALLFFALRDLRASDRCEALGGQTWDSGEHCVIGGTVVSTR